MAEIKLTKNEEYQVNLYPTERVVVGKYLGTSEKEHILSANIEGNEAYLFLSNHWTELRNGIVTADISSAAVYSGITKQALSRMNEKEKSELVEKLNQVGVAA